MYPPEDTVAGRAAIGHSIQRGMSGVSAELPTGHGRQPVSFTAAYEQRTILLAAPEIYNQALQLPVSSSLFELVFLADCLSSLYFLASGLLGAGTGRSK